MPEVLPYIGTIFLKNQPIGTGFLVHTSGIVATCYHVVKRAGEPVEGKVFSFAPLSGGEHLRLIMTNKFDQVNDLALLNIDGEMPPGLKMATLMSSDNAKPGTTFRIQGYGILENEGASSKYFSALGTITGPTNRAGIEMIQLNSKQILQGMSGGPVVIAETGEVAAVLSGRYSVNPNDQFWMRDTAFAVPIDKLISLEPAKLTNVTQNPISKTKIYMMYVKSDKRLADQLKTQLTLLQRQQKIDLWTETMIAPGSREDEDRKENLRTSKIILVLVSADFLASDYFDDGLVLALEKNKTRQNIIIPIILRACEWKESPLGKLQSLPRNQKPINEHSNKDAAFADIAREIRQLLERFNH